MPLHLVTGPANAGKAKVVLDAVRAQAARDPLLVVPTLRDTRVYTRELAETGAVFGPRVLRFTWLVDEIAGRTGVAARRVSTTQRERLVAAAVERAALRTLREAAGSRGFAGAAGELIAELQRSQIEPARFGAALDAWAGGDGGRRAYGADVAAIYTAYRSLLEGLGRVDEDLLAWRAATALRERPQGWGTNPVLVYGFDDFTPVQLDVLESLARVPGVTVTVALTYEPRGALAGRARAFQELVAVADHHESLAAQARYYGGPSPATLHHVERRLFEDEPGVVGAGGAVTFLEAGGERGEAELIAAEVLALVREHGIAPAEIAVVHRAPDTAAPLLEHVLAAYGVPCSRDRTAALGDTALGRGVLALLRCALTDAAVADLLLYLRTPGLLSRPARADELEAEVRRRGLTTAAQAQPWCPAAPLAAIERLRAAARRDPVELLAALEVEVDALFAAPYRRSGRTLDPAERVDARVCSAIREAIRELAELATADPSLAPAPADLAGVLDPLTLRLGTAGDEGVQLLGPLELRGRRVRALVLCGLQEGVFPRPGRPEPFLSDELRRHLAEASGIVLRERERTEEDERALFYACASRPEERLVLAWRTADDEGQPAVRSFYVDDVADLLDGVAVRRRGLAEATWPLAQAPTERERALARALAGPRVEPAPIASLTAAPVLAELTARPAWSARALEDHTACPVRWFVDHVLRPDTLDPEPEPMARGSAAHAVLEEVMRRLREEEGSARVTGTTLRRARQLLDEALKAGDQQLALSTVPARRRSAFRRLEADLHRYLARLADTDTALEPTWLEWAFGAGPDAAPGLDLGDGLTVSGRVDRVDVAVGAGAVVVDYKGGKDAGPYAGAKWEPDGQLQVALYLLAVERVLGEPPAGGLYQPLGGEQQARGTVVKDGPAAPLAGPRDRVDADVLRARLDAAESLARAAASAIRTGALVPRPATCGYKGSGCAYPGICRCERP